MTEWEDMVLVGEVGRPHGLRGHLFVRPTTDFPDDRFRPGARVWARLEGQAPRALTLGDARWHGGRLVVLFEGVDSIEAAVSLGRVQLRVHVDELRSLPPGQYYHHDLVGCRVNTVEGDAIGVVTRVEDAGATSLVVRGRLGETLVPLAASICVAIDVVSRHITIDPPPGLLEVNQSHAASLRQEASESGMGM